MPSSHQTIRLDWLSSCLQKIKNWAKVHSYKSGSASSPAVIHFPMFLLESIPLQIDDQQIEGDQNKALNLVVSLITQELCSASVKSAIYFSSSQPTPSNTQVVSAAQIPQGAETHISKLRKIDDTSDDKPPTAVRNKQRSIQDYTSNQPVTSVTSSNNDDDDKMKIESSDNTSASQQMTILNGVNIVISDDVPPTLKSKLVSVITKLGGKFEPFIFIINLKISYLMINGRFQGF